MGPSDRIKSSGAGTYASDAREELREYLGRDEAREPYLETLFARLSDLLGDKSLDVGVE